MTLPKLSPPQTGLPKLGPPPSPQQVVWKFIQRLQILPTAGLLDTSSLGDMPLPSNGLHAAVDWQAIDTTANTSASFAGLQVATAGGAIDAGANYVWVDQAVNNTEGGVLGGPAAAGSPNGRDTAWNAFVTTGGGTGAAWHSTGIIWLPYYSDPNRSGRINWQTTQINASQIASRNGAGYKATGGGPITKLHFFSRAGNLGPGTTFDLFVALVLQ